MMEYLCKPENKTENVCCKTIKILWQCEKECKTEKVQLGVQERVCKKHGSTLENKRWEEAKILPEKVFDKLTVIGWEKDCDHVWM